MKNKQHIKHLLSGIVLMVAIFMNVNHCQKNKLSLTMSLSRVVSISTCHAEETDANYGDNPVLRSLTGTNNEMTEEEYLELLRSERK